MSHLDGSQITRDMRLEADVVVIGSGPAGSSAAEVAARRGRWGAAAVVLEALRGRGAPAATRPAGASRAQQ